MRFAIVGEDYLTREVYRFAWKRTIWKLVSYTQQTRRSRDSRKWIDVAEWSQHRKNWTDIVQLAKPLQVPVDIKALVRLRARKAEVEV